MEFNVNSSRLRTPFAYYESQSGSDSKGRALPRQLVIPQIWFDVKMMGDQYTSSNTVMTGQTVTLLSWNNERVKDKGWLINLQTLVEYEVQFVNRGNTGQAMIVTAKAVTK